MLRFLIGKKRNGHPHNAQFNPLDAGEWSAPKFVGENIYTIKGSKGTLYYKSKKKHIEKLESEEDGKYALTTFEYDAGNNLKEMKVDVDDEGVKTTVTTEILRIRNSKDFPDGGTRGLFLTKYAVGCIFGKSEPLIFWIGGNDLQ